VENKKPPPELTNEG